MNQSDQLQQMQTEQVANSREFKVNRGLNKGHVSSTCRHQFK